MPWWWPALHKFTTESAPSPNLSKPFSPGNHSDRPDSLAVSTKSAADFTPSSVAPSDMDTDTTRPAPISFLFLPLSEEMEALRHRCTTKDMDVAHNCGIPPIDAGCSGCPLGSGDHGSVLLFALGCGYPCFGSCDHGSVFLSSVVFCAGGSLSTCFRRSSNSSFMAGGSLSTATSGSSANAFTHSSLINKYLRTSTQRPCWNGTSCAKRQRNLHVTSFSVTESNASRSLLKCTTAWRKSVNTSSHCCLNLDGSFELVRAFIFSLAWTNLSKHSSFVTLLMIEA
mmetsp:Transcript_12566/g.20730  ORF Transcript_12566/g.20730 Transcript_12566/m.20730 type:complete len:283 (+) Transcript_12566:540-1388(+)